MNCPDKDTDCEVNRDISPSHTDGADVDSIEFSPQTPANLKIDFNPICDLRDKVDFLSQRRPERGGDYITSGG